MMIVAVAAVIGFLVLVTWPVLVQPRRNRPKRLDQPRIH